MRVEVAYQDERYGIEVPDDRLIAAWDGPPGLGPSELSALLGRVLENPREFPPLRQAVVPGDRVALALGADVPGAVEAVEAVGRVLQSAGVERGDITVVAEPGTPESVLERIEAGFTVERHDPEDRTHIAYLASTTTGRRIYLNRHLTDADLVLPIGRLAPDPALGHDGPWRVIFPGLSDAETRQAFGRMVVERKPGDRPGKAALDESVQVSWLLGCHFQLGLVPAVRGADDVIGGLGSAVVEQGSAAADRAWGFRAESRAELVVVGVGRPGGRAGFEEVARALDNATRLVQHGGKIVVLSHASGEAGPSLSRLRNIDDPRNALSALKGHESEPDHQAARQVGKALAWADVYLLSDLDPELVEELSMIPLERPNEAGRLARLSGSCLIVSQADRCHATVAGESH